MFRNCSGYIVLSKLYKNEKYFFYLYGSGLEFI